MSSGLKAHRQHMYQLTALHDEQEQKQHFRLTQENCKLFGQLSALHHHYPSALRTSAATATLAVAHPNEPPEPKKSSAAATATSSAVATAHFAVIASATKPTSPPPAPHPAPQYSRQPHVADTPSEPVLARDLDPKLHRGHCAEPGAATAPKRPPLANTSGNVHDAAFAKAPTRGGEAEGGAPPPLPMPPLPIQHHHHASREPPSAARDAADESIRALLARCQYWAAQLKQRDRCGRAQPARLKT